MAKPVAEVIAMANESKQFSDTPVAITRYVAFTVNATFQDRIRRSILGSERAGYGERSESPLSDKPT